MGAGLCISQTSPDAEGWDFQESCEGSILGADLRMVHREQRHKGATFSGCHLLPA